MNIDILCHSGSPIGVTLEDLYGKGDRLGVGGAEYALLTMCETWHKAGHKVRLYNNPRNPGGSPFEQLPIRSFRSGENRDVLIGFRVLDMELFARSKGMKVWWSCDQYATGDFQQFGSLARKVVCISPCHQEYFKSKYGITDTVSIDLPVRVGDYATPKEKISKRCLFSSVPDRGLPVLAEIWGKVVEAVPDASLVITSDYRLWTGNGGAGNEPHKLRWARLPNVQFMGAVRRKALVEEQQKADILSYPCTYQELFCIAVAEAQVAGAYPITSSIGALETTNMGTQQLGNPLSSKWKEAYTETLITYLQEPELLKIHRELVRIKALQRFDPGRILAEWDAKVFQ